jgi:DNA-directed RNA polymerase subunit RPC12/RpoP
MGIRFSCPACGRGLNVKTDLAGKRGRCPHCQAKIIIPDEDARPAEVAASVAAAPESHASGTQASGSDTGAVQPASTPAAPFAGVTSDASPAATPQPATTPIAPAVAAAPAVPVIPAVAAPATNDPLSEAPQQPWYVMPPGASNQYGPATGEEFRGWIQEGRVTADSLVWRQDWPQWKPAGSVFPELQTTAAGDAPPAPAAAVPMPGGVPLPNAAVGAYPMAVGLPPVAPMAVPAGMSAPGFAPAASAIPGFNITPVEASTSTAKRSARPYRARSSKGPMVAIIVLVVLMIPLSYLVIRVLSNQLVNSPPPAASSKQAEE